MNLKETAYTTARCTTGSEFFGILQDLKMADVEGHFVAWENDVVHELLIFWEQIFESEITRDPMIAAEEYPPRQELLEATRTLLKFFKHSGM